MVIEWYLCQIHNCINVGHFAEPILSNYAHSLENYLVETLPFYHGASKEGSHNPVWIENYLRAMF